MPKTPAPHSPVPGRVPGGDTDEDHSKADRDLLMQAIYSQYSYDFRDYASASQKRRVTKALAQLDYPTIPALQSAIAQDPAVFMQLLQYLTIPVSEMFRDPSFFLALRQQVMPVLRT